MRLDDILSRKKKYFQLLSDETTRLAGTWRPWLLFKMDLMTSELSEVDLNTLIISEQ